MNRNVIVVAIAIALAVPLAGAAQTTPSWQVPDAPMVSLGSNEEFASITSGTFFSDGGFVIGDVMNARLLVFDAQGRLEKTIGRSGGGPGEFQNLAWARAIRGDSIATYDRAQRRLTVFTRTGTRTRSVNITSPGDGWGPEALALLDDGRILVQGARSIGAERAAPGIHPSAMELWVYSPEGTPINRIATNLVSLQWVKLVSPNLLMPRPFGVVSLVASRGSTIFVADSADAPIRELSASGAEVRRVGRPATRAPSVDHIAEYRENQLSSARRSSNANAVAMQTRILDATPFPDRVPAFRRMFVDHDRRLWVEEYPAARSTRQRLRVYAPDGRVIANVVGPDRGRMLDVHGMRALVAWSDPDGVPFVRVYQIQPK